MTTALQCVCGYPGCRLPAYRRRQNTAYHDEESNYATLCADHHAEEDDYWNERWNDYYSDIRASLVAAHQESRHTYYVC